MERTPDPHNGRAKLLRLTTEGRGYGALAAEALETCMASFTEQFSAEDKASLHALLARLERGADWHRAKRMWRATEYSLGRRRFSIHVR